MTDNYNPLFVCPECGRAPIILNGFTIRSDGSLFDGMHRCINEHIWEVITTNGPFPIPPSLVVSEFQFTVNHDSMLTSSSVERLAKPASEVTIEISGYYNFLESTPVFGRYERPRTNANKLPTVLERKAAADREKQQRREREERAKWRRKGK